MTCVQALRQDATTVGNVRAPWATLEIIEARRRSLGTGGRINGPQRLCEQLPLFPIRKIETVPNEMDDARLQRRRGIDGREGVAHAFQAVGDRDEDALAAAGLQIGEDLHPEFRAFGLLNPEPEDLATAVR